MTANDEPLLSNLTFSLAYAKEGDIVFLTTDGVSDNFDPVVQRLQNIAPIAPNGVRQESFVNLSSLSLGDRHAISLQCMQRTLNRFSARSEETLTASSLCGELMRHALLISQDKRAVLEDEELYSNLSVFNRKTIEKVHRSSEVKQLLASTRGKTLSSFHFKTQEGGYLVVYSCRFLRKRRGVHIRPKLAFVHGSHSRI